MSRDWAPDWVQTGSEVVWLDDDHAVSFIVPQDQADPVGGVLFHRKDPPENGFTFCAGSFYWAQPPTYKEPVTLWQLEILNPLTLSPSILCGCGMHGWIKQGKWVPA